MYQWKFMIQSLQNGINLMQSKDLDIRVGKLRVQSSFMVDSNMKHQIFQLTQFPNQTQTNYFKISQLLLLKYHQNSNKMTRKINRLRKIKIYIKLVRLKNLNWQIRLILRCNPLIKVKWMLLLKTLVYLFVKFQLTSFKKSQRNQVLTLRLLQFKRILMIVYLVFSLLNYYCLKKVKNKLLPTDNLP